MSLGPIRREGLTAREIGTLPQLNFVTVSVADAVANLAVLGKRPRYEFRSPAFPQPALNGTIG